MEKAIVKNKYFDKIKPVLRKIRFSQINMDDMARHMDISKATLYKYFTSKDEIITMFVDHCADYLKMADAAVADEAISFAQRFRHSYEHSLKTVIYMPDILLHDLRELYPHLYEKLMLAMQDHIRSMQRFIDAGAEAGVFRRVSASLYVVQDDAVLRRIFEPSFSIQFDVTLKQALVEFYLLKKHQLIVPEMLHTVDDAEVERDITQIIQRI
ncbi:TetR/AcrR family transcriptional regulator [Paenibacillus hamazuiensis]|uniref:TetR/AcrR family transcriptional regulator n=1 Tax=Paenibacillus hamazuiensis TaxID=2936508 RepID=UPI00200DC04D|nr:TetR/AcrR family transcriptional regulator [Paenibacillus hamazuiensis]